MRVLMIGLGQIARKAYLPVLATRADLDVHLVTRHAGVLVETGTRYRTGGLYRSLDEAFASGSFDAAFVHAAADAHGPLVEQLLGNGVAVFVDKPLTESLESAERLVEQAARMKRPLMVGFNRRYAPAYAALKGHEHQTLLMWKHRRQPGGAPRETVFDDFIHVVDTLRFLSDREQSDVHVQTIVRGGALLSILLTLSTPTHVAVGMMNRSAGLDEERLEMIGGGGRRAVLNLSEAINFDACERRVRPDDWTPVSVQRGFEAMCEDFLTAVRTNRDPAVEDILATHRICETIVRQAEGKITR